MPPPDGDGINDGTIIPGEGGRGFGTGNADGGAIAIAAFLIVATILGIGLLASIIGWIQSWFPQPAPAGPGMCSTSCAGFVRLECPTNRIMSACFGIEICGDPVHTCGTNPP